MANAPYGYRKVTVDRKPTLEIYEPEAKFVRMMYDLYLQGYGCVSIARHVNALGAKPHRSAEFTRNSVAHILRNPTFAGKIVWDQKTHIRKGAKGNPKHVTIYNPRESWTVVNGIHPAIIDQETYDKVQAIMAGRYIPSKRDGTVRSPMAGLVRCTNCGGHMQRLTMKGGPYLLCTRPGCCASARFELVEHRVLSYLRDTLARLEVERQTSVGRDTSVLDATLAAIKKELVTAAGQKTRLYELLEIGEYDIPTFRERMVAVKEKIANLERRQRDAERAIQEASMADPSALAAKIRAVLDAYDASDAAGRNALLKGIIDTVWYTKAKKSKPTDFQLRVDLKPL